MSKVNEASIVSAAAEPYWNQPAGELLAQLESSAEGLKSTEAEAHLARVGRNLLQAKKQATALGLFLNQFKSPIILILLFAALLSLVLKDWADAIIVLLIVLGSAILSFIQEYNASNATQKLQAQVSLKATVMRDSQALSLPAEEIVPGDIVLLSAGSLIPADGVVLEAQDCFVNQAILTGETFPVETSCQLIAKGALSNVLETCTNTGENRPLDAESRASIEQQFGQWSEQGYRVLGVADKVIDARERYSRDDEQGLRFAGFLLFFDPPKPGVKETVTDLAELGVALKIITGDNRLVALHTAQDIGLEMKGVLTGAELDSLTSEALWARIDQVNLFAEVDPSQKERIIDALQKTGHVVGYMGDGINDAPSLHTADVGISVDQAVDVAKEAADFVLLRKDLSVLHQGIIEGRKTFASSMKYIFMATSANFGNMFSMAGASIFLPFLPMLPKQILLINFLTDLPEMTIATDNIDAAQTGRPQHWDIGLIRRFMLIFGPLSSVFDFMTFGLLYFVLKTDEATFHTGWFVESVLSAMLVVFVLRTRLPFSRSRPGRGLMVATAIVALVALILPYSPLAGILGFSPLPVKYLLALMIIVVLYVVSTEVVKRWFFRRYA